VTLGHTYPLRLVCRLLGVPRSSAYYTPATPTDDTMLANAILDLAEEWPTYGYRRITEMLRRLDWRVNAKRVRRIMDDLGLAGSAPPRRVRTTNSDHAFPRYANLVKDLKIVAPEHVWVADITYVKLPHEFVYLAIIMDVFTRIIRGWNLGRSLDQSLTLAALERALLLGVPKIHHSDQGVQYAATAYVEKLRSHGTAISMAAVGEPRENGYAERLMRTLKEEAVSLSDYRTLAEARSQLASFIDAIYNTKRIHSSLGYLTPREFEARWQAEAVSRTMALSDGEDRAPVGTDPSASSGPVPMGAAGCCSARSVGSESDKSNQVVSEI
jgi:putative transposase